MSKAIQTDICVIGAGSGGLSIAAVAVQMGAKVILIEKNKMGGDCLNYGCIPSKALIKAAHIAHYIRNSSQFGIEANEPKIDMKGVEAHIKEVIAKIAPNDSIERFTQLGCHVIIGTGSFVDKTTISVGNELIKARYIVVATGSRAFIPGIPGLDIVPYYTNETIFDVTETIDHLLIIGGGPIGSEMAQSYRRLGSRISLISHSNLMPRGDQECVHIIRDQFIKEKIAIYENTEITSIKKSDDAIFAQISSKNGENLELQCSHILVSAGRTPVLSGLNLAKAGIKTNIRGIETNKKLRTTNKCVFAIGDCAGGPQFTHIASYHAGIIIRNILFKLPAKVNYNTLPWVTYTDPEFAHTGLNEIDAKKTYGKINVIKWKFSENDRAHAERETEGIIKVITTKKGVVIGASIVGPRAGELLTPWIMAIQEKMKIGKIAGLIIPYPTLSEISKRVAGQYFTSALFSNRTRRIVRLFLKI